MTRTSGMSTNRKYRRWSLVSAGAFVFSLVMVRLLGPVGAFELDPLVRRLLIGLASAGTASGLLPLVLAIEKLSSLVHSQRSPALLVASFILFFGSLACLLPVGNVETGAESALFSVIGAVSGLGASVLGRRLFDTIRDMSRLRFGVVASAYVGGMVLALVQTSLFFVLT